MAQEASYERAVSAWAAHLVAGGATPWAAWIADAGSRTGTAVLREPLPDAVHLELVRRLNLASDMDASRLSGLAERVLTMAAPGRGLVDVPLPWPHRAPRFGTPAVDPGLLPTEELVRLASGVLAHLLPDVPAAPRDELPTRLPLPWRRRFRLHGAPRTVAALRSGLLGQGLVESDHRAVQVVVGLPLDVLMAEHWAVRVRQGGVVKWRTLWRQARTADRLPAAVDIATMAERLESQSSGSVHVVVAPSAGRAATLVAELLGARPLEPPPAEDLAGSDLLRRVNRLASLTAGPDHVVGLAAALSCLLEELTSASGTAGPVGQAVPPPLVPAPMLPWAHRAAASTAERLGEGGYPVHGSPDVLAPTEHRLRGTVDRERTLELAVAACLRIWDGAGPQPPQGPRVEGARDR